MLKADRKFVEVKGNPGFRCQKNDSPRVSASSSTHLPTSSCSRATSASFSSSVSAGLQAARFLGGSRLPSWVGGCGLDASGVSGHSLVCAPKKWMVVWWARRAKRGPQAVPLPCTPSSPGGLRSPWRAGPGPGSPRGYGLIPTAARGPTRWHPAGAILPPARRRAAAACARHSAPHRPRSAHAPAAGGRAHRRLQGTILCRLLATHFPLTHINFLAHKAGCGWASPLPDPPPQVMERGRAQPCPLLACL